MIKEEFVVSYSKPVRDISCIKNLYYTATNLTLQVHQVLVIKEEFVVSYSKPVAHVATFCLPSFA